MWGFRGDKRPKFAIQPKPEQESVWDYPRPPVCQADGREVLVKTPMGQTIAKTNQAIRILETASPPTFYIPPSAVNWELLLTGQGSSFCEWKGQATYWNVVDKSAGSAESIESSDLPVRIAAAGWSYENPNPKFVEIKDHISFYPSKLACFVNGERVRAQEGGFYGGWVTDEIVGPYKGQPGTLGW